MSITSAISSVISAYQLSTRKNLSSFCFLETSDGKHMFVGKDGSLASVVKINGAKNLLGSDDMNSIVDHLQTRMAPYFDQDGHAMQVWFARDKDQSQNLVREFLTPTRNVARQLDLDLDDLFQEREQLLPNHLTWEEYYIVLWTRLSVLSKQEIKSTMQKQKKPKFMPQITDAQDSNRIAEDIKEHHIAFVQNFLTDWNEINIRTEVLEAHDALNAMRLSVYPDLIGSDWRGTLPTDPVKTRLPEAGSHDASHLLWPRIENQLFDREAEYVNPRVVRIGALNFASLDMVVGPQKPEKFSILLARLSDLEEIPWRISFLLEGGGFRSLGIKNFLASVFQMTNSENRRIREAIEELQELRLEGSAVVKCRISFSTWAPANDSQLIEKRVSQLQKCVEGWGYCKASPLAGDPLASVMSSCIGLDSTSTAPAGLMPLSEVLTMLPWDRDASPWENSSVQFRTADGRPWPYQPGSSLQDTNIDLIFGPPGRGKSIFLNSINLAMCLNPSSVSNSGSKSLPRISIIDVGPSSSGLISLLRDSLPAERRHEAVYHKLQMTKEHAINPFDTQLGCRYPLPSEKTFLVNFLTILGTELGSASPPSGLTGIVNAAVDILYERFDDDHRRGMPKSYRPQMSSSVDLAIERHGIQVTSGETYWWEIVDNLFELGDIRNATLAQRFASPMLEDMMTVLREQQIVDIFGEARIETGERIIDVCSRVISNAIRELPILQRPTRFEIGDAKVVSLDLEDVAPKGGGAADKQTALMYMLARFVAARDFYLTPESVSQIPEPYKSWHTVQVRRLKEVPKRLVYDEFHRTANAPLVREQVLSDMREGRKWGLQISLASQLLQDFDKNMVDMASGYWIMGVTNDRAAKEVAGTFGLSPTAERYLKTRLTGPGRNGAPMLAVLGLKSGMHEHLLYLTLGPNEIWAFSTTVEDCALRQQLYSLLGPAEARRRLAARFQTGTAKSEIERRLAEAMNQKDVKADIVERSVIEMLVGEIASTPLPK